MLLIGGIAVGIAIAGSVVFVSYRGAMSYVHPPRRFLSSEETPAQYAIPYEDIILYTTDGVRLVGWYTPPQIHGTEVERSSVILVAHGIAYHHSPSLHAFFAEHGYGVVSWDFRAHGESGGDLCTIGYLEALDVEAALDFALAQPGVTRVGAWGGSMGGAAILRAAARRSEIEAVVVDSTFASLEETQKVMVRSALLRPLVRFFAEQEAGLRITHLRPVDEIGLLSPRPVFIIQGDADTVIPQDSAQQLYEAAGEPRAVWTAPGVEHLGMKRAYPEEYEQRVLSFFDQQGF
ncbi:MAG: alpha/beta hydrolase [Anaerolineae bacterium]|nr:alpha/beta hydrolase [Anaerolineae bacterium]